MRPAYALLWAEKSAGAGSYCRASRIGIGYGKAWFYWVFLHGTALAEKHVHELSAAIRAALLEFRHVLCSGRCVIGHRCPQGADVVEIVCANHRRQPGRARARSICRPRMRRLRSVRGFRIRRRRFADIAADHERAARCAEPVLGRVDDTASKSRSAALKDLFGQIDGDGDGKISKKEFEEALGAGGTNLKQADSVFGKLDKDGDGSVSLKELASALKGGKGHHHDHAASSSGDGDGSNSDPFSQALQGASSTSVTNSDGSVTTSLTYADGSKVTMTSAAGKSSSASATSSYNFIEQMIQRQAQAISSAATASLSVSV